MNKILKYATVSIFSSIISYHILTFVNNKKIKTYGTIYVKHNDESTSNCYLEIDDPSVLNKNGKIVLNVKII